MGAFATYCNPVLVSQSSGSGLFENVNRFLEILIKIGKNSPKLNFWKVLSAVHVFELFIILFLEVKEFNVDVVLQRKVQGRRGWTTGGMRPRARRR